MKNYMFILLVVFITTSGFIGSNKIFEKNLQEETILDKVANANGFQNWRNVEEIKFTFNVDKDTTHFERTWLWKPKTNEITAITTLDTLVYNWSNMDSVAHKTNGGFINDKFWLLAPFQLIWDADNISHAHVTNSTAPISKKSMQKLTIVYGNEGGYTPGDAYDFYFENDYIVREWVFRKANQPEPSMVTTFEDYEVINGLNIAKTHKMAEGNFNLHFTNIEVKTN